MNEVEQFLKDTETDLTKTDVLEAPLIPDESAKTEGNITSEGAKGEGEGENGEVKPRNRRERRLAKALQEEREGSIFLAGKLEARTEATKSVTEEADYLKAVERIYGTDSPESLLATELLKKAITGARDDAENRAYERMLQDRKQDVEKQRAADTELETMIEEIEDEHGITLTEAQERAFIQLLGKMSPKDKSGVITAYADSEAVWEVFAEKLTKPSAGNTRAKDLSSRSMVNSGASKESNLQEDVTARFLKEQGII